MSRSRDRLVLLQYDQQVLCQATAWAEGHALNARAAVLWSEVGRPKRKLSCGIARNATTKDKALSGGSSQTRARSQSITEIDLGPPKAARKLRARA